MPDFPHRRAAVLWVRRLLTTAVFFLASAAGTMRFGGDAVYAAGRGASLLSWLSPSVLFCLFAMAAGTSVFGSALLRLECTAEGAAFGAVCALTAAGRLLVAHPAAVIACSVLALLLRAGLCAAVQAGSERLTAAYGAGDASGFRAALWAGGAVSLTCSGCVMAASVLLRLAAG